MRSTNNRRLYVAVRRVFICFFTIMLTDYFSWFNGRMLYYWRFGDD